MKPICLTIAGSDPTSGAGIQADIRTFDRIGVHPFSAITAITYQTASKFYGYQSLSDELEAQLDVILTAYPIKYVKIGMIPDIKSVKIIKDAIMKYDLFAVLDPVTASSTGMRLSSEGVELEIEKELFPVISVLTPNFNEAKFYINEEINHVGLNNLEVLKKVLKIFATKLFSGKNITNLEKAIIIKSIINTEAEIYDYACFIKINKLKYNFDYKLFKKQKLPYKGNIHGTGCVFSSALTAYLAKGNSIRKSIESAELFFDEKFQKYIELPSNGKTIDLTLSNDEIQVIHQIKDIYNYISEDNRFSALIPEVRMNISMSLPNAKNKKEVAGIEGRITIIDGFPYASGEIKFGVSDHTARLILEAKKYVNSVNIVMNLKYNSEWINLIKSKTDLKLKEIKREEQPKNTMLQEDSTMQWLIKKSINEMGMIPDIIWDKGSIGKEPMLRLFGKDSEDIKLKLKKIIQSI